MAEPTQEDIDNFNAGVQAHIDAQHALGNNLSWDEAVTQFSNLLANQAADPEATDKATHPEDRVAAIERELALLTERVAYLEDVGGGTVVGG
jgi:hypothetical protein